MAKYENDIQIRFDTVEPHGLPRKTRKGLTVGMFAQEGASLKAVSRVQLVDPTERPAFDSALSANPPRDTSDLGTWVTAKGDDLYYWLSRQNAALEVETGHSLFEESMMLRNLGTTALILTIESRYSANQ